MSRREGAALIWDWRAFLLAAVIFTQQMLFGGQGAVLGLLFSLEDAALLLALLFAPRYRAYLSEMKGVVTLGALLLLILTVQILDLTPLFPNPTSSVWRLVAAPLRAAPYPAGVIVECTKLLALACLFLCGALLSQERRQRETLLSYLLIGGIVFALFCLVLNALNLTPMTETKASISTGRVSGLFSSPNTAATAFAINGVLAAGLFFRKVSSGVGAQTLKYRLFSDNPLELSGLLLNTGCLVLTGSRGGLLAYAIALLVLAGPALIRGGRTKQAPAVAGLFLVGLLVASTGAGMLIDRFFHAENVTSGRSEWLQLYFQDALRAPVGGYGLGSFASANRFYVTPANFKLTSWAGAVHDLYVQWFLEGGLLCGALLILILISAIIFIILTKGNLRVLIPSIIVLVGVNSIYEYSMQEFSISSLLFLIIGIGFGSIRLLARGPRDKNHPEHLMAMPNPV